MSGVNPIELSYRQAQAQETRRRIVGAARTLFGSAGYASATMEAVAREAGVASRTVYTAFGTKKAILGAVCDDWLARAGVRELFPGLMAEDDPDRRLALVAHLSRQQWELGQDVVPMLEAAAAADAEVRTMLDGWKGERSALLRAALESIGSALRPDLPLDEAAATLRALTGAEIFAELTRGEGWSGDRYEEWLTSLLRTELLGRPHPASGAG